MSEDYQIQEPLTIGINYQGKWLIIHFLNSLKQKLLSSWIICINQTSVVRLTTRESEWSLLSCLAHDSYLIVPSWLESVELPLQSFPRREPLFSSFDLMVERIGRVK